MSTIIVVGGQVHGTKLAPKPNPLTGLVTQLILRWVDKKVDRVLSKLRPLKPRGPIYKPQHVSN